MSKRWASRSANGSVAQVRLGAPRLEHSAAAPRPLSSLGAGERHGWDAPRDRSAGPSPLLFDQLATSLLHSSEPAFFAAAETLRLALGATGLAFGEWPGRGDPRLFATAGEVGVHMSDPGLFRFFGEVFEEGERAPTERCSWLDDPVSHYAAGFRRPGTDLLALVLRSPSQGSESLQGASLELLRLVDVLRERAAVPRLGSPRGTLAVPLSFVRCVSPGMREVYGLIEAMRFADLPVLFSGETGVGKEHLVRLLHDASPRAASPFVAVNCAAIPAELLEAEMFGVGRGAATGVAARRGMFQIASGGTLFLDEIGELPLAMQSKLLRALEGGQVQPIGGRGADVDVRIVAATNTDLRARSIDGSFRADLYYRLAGCLIEVPALRERRGDLPALIDHFLGRACIAADRAVPPIEPGAKRRLLAYDWPGNVRELEHEIRRLAFTCPQGRVIGIGSLSATIQCSARPAPVAPPNENAKASRPLHLRHRIDALSRELVAQALEESAGNQVVAARLLGVSRNGLAGMVRRLSIRPRFAP